MVLVKCRECGKMISEEAGACPQCGKPVEIIEEAPAEEKKGGTGRAVLSVLLLLILAGGGYYAYTYYNKNVKGKEKDILNSIHPEKEKEPAVLADGEVPVDEYNYHSFKVELEKTSEVRLIYSVSSGPDVDILTLDNAQFMVWKDAEDTEDAEVTPVTALSVSGKKKGTLSASLTPGTYFIVVDNTNYGQSRPPTNTVNDRVRVKVKITVLEE